MLSLTDRDAVTAALTDTSLDPSLRALIGLRVWQVDTDRRRPLGDVLQIVVIQPGDQPEVIHEAVGFPITWDQAEQPGWEWMNDHGAYFELCYVLTDDFGMLERLGSPLAILHRRKWSFLLWREMCPILWPLQRPLFVAECSTSCGSPPRW